MNSERDFSSEVRKILKSAGMFVTPVESGATAVGIPDVFARSFKTSAWIELKFLRFPVTYTLKVPFRPRQRAWLNKYTRMGGRSVLGIRALEGFYFFVDDEIQDEYDLPTDKGIFTKTLTAPILVKLIDGI